MVYYSASKHASLALYEGLAIELKTRYRADKVRTVIVNQGHTRTPLFEGYSNVFSTVSHAQARDRRGGYLQIGLGGKECAGHCPCVCAGAYLGTAIAIMPNWFQYKVREDGSKLMRKWRERQVITYLNRPRWAKEKKDGEGILGT